MAALLASCFPEDDAERLYDEVPLDVLGKAARDNEAVLADFLRALRACEAAERQSAAAQAGLARVAKRVAAVGASPRGFAVRAARPPTAPPRAPPSPPRPTPPLEVARERKRCGASAPRLKHRLALRERYRDLDGARVAAATAVYRGDVRRASAVEAVVAALLETERAHLSARLGAVVPAPAAEADRALRRAKRFADARAEPDATRRYAAALRVLDWDFQRRQTARDEPETLASLLPPVVSRAAAALFRVGHKVDATREHVQVLQNFPHARRAILATIGRFRDAPDLGDRDAALAVDALAALFCAAVKAKDAHGATQALVLAATFYRETDGDRAFVVEAGAFREAAHAAIDARGADAFYDDALLDGVAGELRLVDVERPSPWDDHLDDAQLAEAVLHVHTVLFNRLVAVVANMRLLGEPDDVVAAFASRTANSAQLPAGHRASLRALLADGAA
ncbi:heparan sulfate sulfotransferase [Aureococcus anophagefferens]|nr:heparan sulfate sulfotransferase [Aureococcus anophagefferens]